MKISETFKILSDDQRREIITMLRGGRMNAGEIAEKLNVTPAALSYHLKLLKKADTYEGIRVIRDLAHLDRAVFATRK